MVLNGLRCFAVLQCLSASCFWWLDSRWGQNYVYRLYSFQIRQSPIVFQGFYRREMPFLDVGYHNFDPDSNDFETPAEVVLPLVLPYSFS